VRLDQIPSDPHVGEQKDEVDGLELVVERPA
jgi:hypothetical protein